MKYISTLLLGKKCFLSLLDQIYYLYIVISSILNNLNLYLFLNEQKLLFLFTITTNKIK